MGVISGGRDSDVESIASTSLSAFFSRKQYVLFLFAESDNEESLVVVAVLYISR
jgi:hypothetical protein